MIRAAACLLSFAWTLRRTLDRVIGSSSLFLGSVPRLLRLAMRGFFLMRRMRMILGLEVLGLVLRTFGLADHEISGLESK